MEGANKGSWLETQGERKLGGKEGRRIDSLGWITESSVMPKKQRAINGVGAASILELRAELYRTQEDAKRVKDGGLGDLDTQRSRKKLAMPDLFSRKNSGVEDRAGRDKLHLKAENDGSASYTALEKKAELYDKLARGEVPIEDEEKYNVLFYKKGTLENEFQEMESEKREEAWGHTSGPEVPSYDNEKPQMGQGTTGLGHGTAGLGQSTANGLTQEQKLLIKEVNEETKQERQKAFSLKQKREEAAAKKREELRNAYIKKKLEEMKAASRNSTQLQSPGDGTPLVDANAKLESPEAA